MSRENTPLLPTSQPEEDERRQELIGLVWMAFTSLGFSFSSLFVKLSGASFPPLEIVFSRSIVQFLFAFCGCLYQGVHPFGKRELVFGLIIRGFAGAFGLALFYVAVANLPLADATVLFFMGPIFTAILARLVLKESFGPFDQLASFTSLFGVGLIAKPEFIFGENTSHEIDPQQRLIGVVAALLGAVMSAIAYVTVRKMGRGVPPLVHVVYFGAVSTVFSLFGTLTFEKPSMPVNSTQWVYLAMVGLTAFAGQVMLTKGLQLSPAGPGTLMRNFDVVFAFVFGILIFHETPDRFTIGGAILIIGSTVAMGLHKWRLSVASSRG
ncbi:hypothetical protein K493DRAFT_315937 [Basidiobolus meristosporus CBS 931.73]|uniref:EamA domain-containing protein n=1 Tax=Basidiobolus meristosporus CBS 931.73 TaxID=1314790 RepID=A0A1Y1Y6F1_9FUNG|nr:hypothetical protein K493DRAFT_315937 [Basidiobolus meristosporus CBS 931.73]|eukprot:ORX93568.1 hypothetical protein K493DRAFT_315937 [Basidiobolus meristosporus CBS 931.73]